MNADGTGTSSYGDALSLREARQRYFQSNDFGADGGYDLAWVKVKIGPIRALLPNTAGRVRAVRFHDLHHVLTGYRTTFHGECEIAAWEIASGCADHRAAWLLNLSAFGGGLLFAPRDLWRAFLRGRRSGNLYRATFDEALLRRNLGEVRRDLRLTAAPGPSRAVDRAAFAAFSLAALPLFVGQLLLTPVILPVVTLLSRLGWSPR